MAGQDIAPSASWAGPGWTSDSDMTCRQQQQQPRDQECQKQHVDPNEKEPRLAKEAWQYELKAPQDRKKKDPFVAAPSSSSLSSSSGAAGCAGDQPAVHTDTATAAPATTIRAEATPASSATTAEDVPVLVGSSEENVEAGWDHNESASGRTSKSGNTTRKLTNAGDGDANSAKMDSQSAAAPRQQPLGQTGTKSGDASAAAAAALSPEKPPKGLGSCEHGAGVTCVLFLFVISVFFPILILLDSEDDVEKFGGGSKNFSGPVQALISGPVPVPNLRSSQREWYQLA